MDLQARGRELAACPESVAVSETRRQVLTPRTFERRQ